MDVVLAAADSFEIRHAAKTFEHAIATGGASAVLIASPNSFHREQAELAFAWGRHVLCEMPLALTLEDSSAIRKAAEQADRGSSLPQHGWLRPPDISVPSHRFVTADA